MPAYRVWRGAGTWERAFSSFRTARARLAASCPTRRAATSTSCSARRGFRRIPSSIPAYQIAFYDGGLGSRADGEGIKIKAWRRLYNLLAQATGLGITQNIIDCYANIIRVWQPGDRIYLFGFSRGAYTVRCVAGVLKHCGVPTAVVCQRTGKVQAAAARHQVGAAHRGRGGEARLPARQLGQGRSASRGAGGARAALPRGVFVRAMGARPTQRPTSSACGTRCARWARARMRSGVLALLGEMLAAGVAGVATHVLGWPFWPLFAALGLGVPAGALRCGCACATRGWRASRATAWRSTILALHYAVRYARQAMAIDENRKKFESVPWDAHDHARSSARRRPRRCRRVSSRCGLPAATRTSAAAIPRRSRGCRTSRSPGWCRRRARCRVRS